MICVPSFLEIYFEWKERTPYRPSAINNADDNEEEHNDVRPANERGQGIGSDVREMGLRFLVLK